MHVQVKSPVKSGGVLGRSRRRRRQRRLSQTSARRPARCPRRGPWTERSPVQPRRSERSRHRARWRARVLGQCARRRRRGPREGHDAGDGSPARRGLRCPAVPRPGQAPRGHVPVRCSRSSRRCPAAGTTSSRSRSAHPSRRGPGPDLHGQGDARPNASPISRRPDRPGSGATIPARAAIIAASMRLDTPSLSRMCVTWTLAVFGLMNSSWAI